MIGYRGVCSLCGASLAVDGPDWHRELGHCPDCGLNARLRGIILALAREVYGDVGLPLMRRPVRKAVRIIGISDNPNYAEVLAQKFFYQNTFLHQEPSLDICDSAACKQSGDNHVVICSDVIEHTLLSPMPVLRNLLSMLRPGGLLILTAPSFAMDVSIEWYGAIVRYAVRPKGEHFTLEWQNLRGQHFVDDAPIFHGGPGSTAELRLLSHAELLSVGERLGVAAETMPFQPEWGYSWPLVRQFAYLDAAVDGRVILMRRPQ